MDPDHHPSPDDPPPVASRTDAPEPDAADDGAGEQADEESFDEPFERPVERPVDRFRKGAVGSVVAAGLLGIADALEARPPKEEIVIVSEVPSEPPREPRRLELLLDPEHPERSLVFLPDPAPETDHSDPSPPGRA